MSRFDEIFLSNEPIDREEQYIKVFFERVLEEFETLDIWTVEEAYLRDYLQKAASLKQAMIDIVSEDGGFYFKLQQFLNNELEAESRIVKFLDEGLLRIGNKTEQELFHLFPDPIEPYCADFSKGFKRFNLDEYLEYIESKAILADFPVYEKGARYWEKYERVMAQLIKYLQFIVCQGGNKTVTHKTDTKSFVFLMRDTLLLYLGMRHLQKSGWAVEAHAMMISRSLLQYFTPNSKTNPLYNTLFDTLFECILKHGDKFSKEFLEEYKHILYTKGIAEGRRLFSFLDRYCSSLLNAKKRYTIVENGTYGNMLLLTMAASNATTDFCMYTAVPWLQDFYSGFLFSNIYTHMRDLESICCQEHLFYFDGIDDDSIFIKEIQDPIIQGTGYREIYLFLEAVDQEFIETGNVV